MEPDFRCAYEMVSGCPKERTNTKYHPWYNREHSKHDPFLSFHTSIMRSRTASGNRPLLCAVGITASVVY